MKSKIRIGQIVEISNRDYALLKITNNYLNFIDLSCGDIHKINLNTFKALNEKRILTTTFEELNDYHLWIKCKIYDILGINYTITRSKA